MVSSRTLECLQKLFPQKKDTLHDLNNTHWK